MRDVGLAWPAAVVVAIILVLAVACIVEDRPASSRLKRAIVIAAPGETIAVADYARFSWSRLYIRRAAASVADIERELHVKFPDDALPREPVEAGVVFLFVEKDRVVFAFRLADWVAACRDCENAAGFERTARFRVEGVYQGEPKRSIEPLP